MRRVVQLKMWVKGKSIHNNTYGQCVPDFSCCGEKKATQEHRIAFIKVYERRDSDPKTFKRMCMDFALGDYPKEGQE